MKKMGILISLPVAIFISFVLETALSAEIKTHVETTFAVRDLVTSESEFQALAMAHGTTPFTEAAMSDSGILLSEKQKDEFTLRLAEAQSEWLQNTSVPLSTAAIERFLKFETAADWTASEREAFETFKRRKPNNIDRKSTRNQRLASDFIIPDDVMVVLVNGAPMSRSEFRSFDFGDTLRRVTFVSNLYQPMTVVMSGHETRWPDTRRELWTSSDGSNPDCKVDPQALFARDWSLKVLSTSDCAAFNFNQNRKTEKSGVPSAFNSAIEAASTWNEASEKSSSKLIEKPWFWGVLGAVAIGAVIAIEQSQKSRDSASTTPAAAREAW